MSREYFVIHESSTPEGPTGLYFYEYARGGSVALVFGLKGAHKFDQERPAELRCGQLITQTGRRAWEVLRVSE